MANRRFLAEWEQQRAILIAWPHRDSDWADMLEEVTACYRQVARAVVSDENLIIVAPDANDVRQALTDIDCSRVTIIQMPTNDTWARDFGPITVLVDDEPTILDFTFNAWGMKFAADKDNLITMRLAQSQAISASIECHRDMVLEGGSVETDGNGTLLTTSQCLLTPNRNAQWNRQDIERELMSRLGVRKVLWLDYGSVPGDDTDSHIDTLARLAPRRNLIHITAPANSEEYDQVQQMIAQLRTMTDADGLPFNLVPLPAPTPMFDDDGNPMPATYANYLVTNHQVLVPTYGQPDNDHRAMQAIASVFTDRVVTPIDCRALIQQHGSLHCITMQLYNDLS